MKQRIGIILFFGIMVGLRLWIAQHKELCFDEFFTVILGLGIPNVQSQFNPATAHSAADWITVYHHLAHAGAIGNLSVFQNDLNPPAYFLSMGPWIRMTSLDTLWLRLPSILAGLGSLGFMALLCRRFLSRATTGFITALMGISSIHLFYSALARPYIVMLMLALLATHLMLSKRWRWYALVCGLGLFTHLFFGLVLLTHGMYRFCTDDDRFSALRHWMTTLTVPILATALWLATGFSQQLTHNADNSIFTPVPLFKLLWHHSILSRWLLYCDKPLPRWNGYALDILTSALIWLLFLTEVIWGRAQKTGAWFQSNTRQLLVLGACWFFLPMTILTAFDVLQGAQLSGTERYLFVFSPGLLFLLGAIIDSYSVRMRIAVMGALLALVALNTGLFLQHRGLPTEKFQALAEQFQPTPGAHDLVLVMSGFPALPALAPYLPPQTPMASIADFSSGNQTAIVPRHIANLTQGHPHVYLVATYSQLSSLAPIQTTLEILNQQGYQVDHKIDLGNIRLGGYTLSRR